MKNLSKSTFGSQNLTKFVYQGGGVPSRNYSANKIEENIAPKVSSDPLIDRLNKISKSLL